MTSYVLASVSGLTVGFYFCLVMSAAIAFMIHVLLTQPSVRRSQLGLPTVRKTVAAPFAFLVWIVDQAPALRRETAAIFKGAAR